MTTFSIPMWAYWLIAIGLLVTIGIIFTLSLCRAAKGPFACPWCKESKHTAGMCETCLQAREEAERRYLNNLRKQQAERN